MLNLLLDALMMKKGSLSVIINIQIEVITIDMTIIVMRINAVDIEASGMMSIIAGMMKALDILQVIGLDRVRMAVTRGEIATIMIIPGITPILLPITAEDNINGITLVLRGKIGIAFFM